MHIPDPIEQLEAWEDLMAHDYANPDGTYKCAECGKTIAPDDVMEAGTPPYVVPVCPKCHATPPLRTFVLDTDNLDGIEIGFAETAKEEPKE